MTRKATISLTAGSAAVIVLLALCTFGVPMLGVLAQQAQAQCAGVPIGVPAGDDYQDWDARQVANATAIVGVGKDIGVPAWGYVIALATAIQESGLLNHANDNPDFPDVVRISMALPHEDVGHDNDSVGLFQQRPDEGEAAQHGRKAWGPVRDLMDPPTSARKFYTALLKVPGWEKMRLTDAAQAVQKSGTPEAYQQHQGDARALAAHVLKLPTIDMIGGGDPSAPCGPGAFGPVPVGPNGWVQPLDLTWHVVAPFGQDRGDHVHAGVDIGGDSSVRNEPIRATADGIVERVTCQAGGSRDPAFCNHDGAPGYGGCGWYVDIRHAGNVVSRYCHQVHAPFVTEGQPVTAGQVIGQVGSSGNSSGPHLHFEIHLNVPPGEGHAGSSNAVDPVRFLAAQGAPIPT